MNGAKLLLSLVVLGAVVPGTAMAQAGAEIRYPDGTVVQPLPVVPSMQPSGDVDITGSTTVTGSTARPAIPASPAPRTDARATTVDRPGCDVQNYAFTPGEQVRVHRC